MPFYAPQSRPQQAEALLAAFLQTDGLPLDDLIIAATALVLNAALVTDNTRHFRRVSGLQLGQPRR